MMLLARLSEDTKQVKTVILYDDPPGMFDSKFLLREQLIGEQRGLERALEIVLLKREELQKQIKETENENETTTTSNSVEPESI